MADVYTVLFTLIGMLISLPGLLVALNLLLPKAAQRTQTRLQTTPGKSFALGLVVTAVLAFFILLFRNGGGPGQFLAISTAVLGMGLGTIGAAGMSRLLSEKLAPISQPYSELKNLLRGAVVYELACLFPIVGWFLFAPLVGITVLGAAAFALLNWLPRPADVETAVPIPATSNQ
ncbi:MAG: hypothetical protein H6662_05140 [Ardenticatenaceae bacterium]|nr:hypothetical protein [Anaerolineales bacterium]MCB8920952.1 hypothetical protein [Ardenticatenaceae bacterium]MCB9004251.1 hypothetical protein [Ardenticatenaceae bacterium]